MDYDETWEVMNNLEVAFNQIIPLSSMLEQLQEAVDSNDRQSIIDITAALNAYVPVYLAQYDKASKRAWNKTVRSFPRKKNYIEDLEYNEVSTDILYNEVVKYYE